MSKLSFSAFITAISALVAPPLYHKPRKIVHTREQTPADAAAISAAQAKRERKNAKRRASQQGV